MPSDLIVYQQGSDNAPTPDGMKQVTNPLHPNRRTPNRLAHFSDEVYDLSSESHIMKLLKTLLGDAGVGQLHKRMMIARLQQTVAGANFYDLDAFYGAILGIRRRTGEILPKNPAADELTVQDWDQLRIRDGSYRSRVTQFARAINLGATPGGIEAVAEAMLGIEVDVIEGWKILTYANRTWGALEAQGGWDDIEALGSWFSVQYDSQLRWNLNGQNVINVYPRRQVTAAEIHSVQTALDRIKPAGTLVVVHQGVPDTYAPVPIVNVHADSSHWEVRSEVRNSRVGGRLLYGSPEDTFVEMVVQPWASFQGEAWSRLAENPATLAYMTPGPIRKDIITDAASQPLAIEKVVIEDQEITFGSAFALRSFQGVMAGRLASDGVVAANPLTGYGHSMPDIPPGQFFAVTPQSPTPPSTVTIDGVPIEVYSLVNQAEYAGRLTQLFWSGPLREQSSPVNDVVEIRFESSGEVNTINFQIAAFPQTVEVQVWTPSPGEWRTVHTYRHYTSLPAGITGRIPPGFLHPYHFGNGHWIPISATFDPVEIKGVRFVFQHSDEGIPPVGFDGNPTLYPVGLKQVDVGFRLNSLETAPNIADGETIVVTKNSLGQSVRHYMFVYTPDRMTDNSETFWKCDAQPVSQAIVNVYLDVSVGEGEPSTFDRIFIDPYQSGPTLNLYWSNTPPVVDDLALGISQEVPIVPDAIVGNIVSVPSGDRGLMWQSNAADDQAYITFDATRLGWNPAADWWIGMEFFANQGSHDTSATTKDLWSGDTTAYRCYLNMNSTSGGTFNCQMPGGASVLLTGLTWNPGSKLTAIWRFNDGVMTMGVLTPDGVWHEASGTQASDLGTPPSLLSIGAKPGVGNPSNKMRMTKFAAGHAVGEDLENVARQLDTYVRKPRFTSGVDHTVGTFLRYHPDYEGRTSVVGTGLGFMGGPVDAWAHVPWTPIAQDFVVDKGYLRIPVTRARYIKMEFTNLAAEPFEPFLSQPKIVNLYNQMLVQGGEYLGRSTADDVSPIIPMSRGAVEGDPETHPFEHEIFPVDYTDRYLNQTRPTVGIMPIDTVAQARLGNGAGFGWNLLQWQPSRVSPQFSETGVHVYDKVQLAHTNKVAFFVGLREVRVLRSNRMAPGNPKAFVDKFFDLNYIESYTSDFDPGVFHTPNNPSAAVLGTPQVVTSKAIPTRSGVTSLQFATQQSPPIQIVPDDQFLNPANAGSTFEDINEWHTAGDAYIDWDTPTKSVRVTRNPETIYAALVPDDPIVHPPVTPVFSTRPANQAVFSNTGSGGIESPLLPVSSDGALYMAVRLTVINASITEPLTMQIIAGDGTTVLKEEDFLPQVNVQVEQTMRYELQGNESAVYARVVQKGSGRGEWLMHALSIFDDSILWEFSNDNGASWVNAIGVRNNVNGLVTFPRPGNTFMWRATMYRNNLGIDSIQIRPWYTREVVTQ